MSEEKGLKERQRELLEVFSGMEDELDRYSFLASLGGKLPEIPDTLKEDYCLVKGCQSRVWLNAGVCNERIWMRSYSDTLIVRGLLYIIQYCVEGAGREEFESAGWEFFEEAGLSELLTEDRKSGLKSILKELEKRIKAQSE